MGWRKRIHIRSWVSRAGRNAWARFSIASIALITAAAIFYVLTITFGHGQVDIFSPIFEALLAAAVLTIIVEPFLRSRFSQTIARELFWVLKNDKAPIPFRHYVENLVRTKVFYTRADWEIHMAWEKKKKVVKLEIQVATTGVNYDANGFSPSGTAYVLASCPKYKSRYTLYCLAGSRALDDERVCNVNMHELSVPPISDFVDDTSPDGRIILDEAHHARAFRRGPNRQRGSVPPDQGCGSLPKGQRLLPDVREHLGSDAGLQGLRTSRQ